MDMKIVYNNDLGWFIGRRNSEEIGRPLSHETPGTHHFTVLSGDFEFTSLIGMELAVPVCNARFFVLNWQKENKQ